jgi:excisionase family DNA binding protein
MSALCTPPVPAEQVPGRGWWIGNAAPYLQVSQRYLENLARKKTIPSYLLGNKRFLSDETVRKLAAGGLEALTEADRGTVAAA